MLAIEPNDSGRRVGRGYLVALGLVAGFAIYGRYEARKPAAFTQHWPDRWSLISHVCTPLDVDAMVHQFEGGTDELLCYAAAGRFDQVRELFGVPGYPSTWQLTNELQWAAHHGDRRARAIVDTFGLADPGLGNLDRIDWAAEWFSCQNPSVTCAIEPPLHPWLLAREACTEAMTLPVAGVERVDPLLCDAAAGRLGALAAASGDDAQRLAYLLEPFFADDARARAAFDAIANRTWTRWYIPLALAHVATRLCHVEVADHLLAQVPDNLPDTRWSEPDIASLRARLAQCR